IPRTDHRVSHHYRVHSLPLGLANNEQGFRRRRVAGFEHQIVLGRDSNYLCHFWRHHAISNDRREWAATPACLIVRIVGRKPDDLAVTAFTFGHPLDRRGVNAADGEIQRDAAEYLYARRLLTNDVGE